MNCRRRKVGGKQADDAVVGVSPGETGGHVLGGVFRSQTLRPGVLPFPMATLLFRKGRETTKKGPCRSMGLTFLMVPRDRIELPTRGFSVPCSTN